MSALSATVDRLREESGYRANPYFAALRDKTFAREDFLETQIQFCAAVVFFHRPMAALAAKIPDDRLRIDILRNVWEEHGEGDPSRLHGATFHRLLERLGGVTPAEVRQRALWPDVRIFNTTLVGACVLDEYLVGAAMLGMIERMFVDISHWTAKGIVDNGWLAPEQMVHYDLHEKLDVKHSDDFFAILEPAWQEAGNRYYVEQGLGTGATLFNGLYEGLWRNRRRRTMREVVGYHTRAY